jgi:hypothetical protein
VTTLYSNLRRNPKAKTIFMKKVNNFAKFLHVTNFQKIEKVPSSSSSSSSDTSKEKAVGAKNLIKKRG